jgi:hypothetical protein
VVVDAPAQTVAEKRQMVHEDQLHWWLQGVGNIQTQCCFLWNELDSWKHD